MPTTDERREVAARLRLLRFTFKDDLEDELSAFYDALECNPRQKRWEINPYWFLADLIEPERTCQIEMIDTGNKAAYEHHEHIAHCHSCHHEFGYVLYNEDGDTWQDEKPNYCPNCGARVKEGE